MVHTYKKSFLFIGLCALAGQQTQAVDFGSLVGGAKNKGLAGYDISVSACQGMGSRVPAIVLTSMLVGQSLRLVDNLKSVVYKGHKPKDHSPLVDWDFGTVITKSKEPSSPVATSSACDSGAPSSLAVNLFKKRYGLQLGDFELGLDVPCSGTGRIQDIMNAQPRVRLPNASNLALTALALTAKGYGK